MIHCEMKWHTAFTFGHIWPLQFKELLRIDLTLPQ